MSGNSTNLDYPNSVQDVTYEEFCEDFELLVELPMELKNYILYDSPYPLQASTVLEVYKDFLPEYGRSNAIVMTIQTIRDFIKEATKSEVNYIEGYPG